MSRQTFDAKRFTYLHIVPWNEIISYEQITIINQRRDWLNFANYFVKCLVVTKLLIFPNRSPSTTVYFFKLLYLRLTRRVSSRPVRYYQRTELFALNENANFIKLRQNEVIFLFLYLLSRILCFEKMRNRSQIANLIPNRETSFFHIISSIWTYI